MVIQCYSKVKLLYGVPLLQSLIDEMVATSAGGTAYYKIAICVEPTTLSSLVPAIPSTPPAGINPVQFCFYFPQNLI